MLTGYGVSKARTDETYLLRNGVGATRDNPRIGGTYDVAATVYGGAEISRRLVLEAIADEGVCSRNAAGRSQSKGIIGRVPCTRTRMVARTADYDSSEGT